MLIRTTLSSFRDVTPLEYLSYMEKGLYFAPGQGGAYSTNAFSLLGLAIAGIQNKDFWYEVDQHELIWGSHYPKPDDDRMLFPTRGTCLENAPNNDPSTMARQYFSDSQPPRYRPDRTFVDISDRSCLNTWFGATWRRAPSISRASSTRPYAKQPNPYAQLAGSDAPVSSNDCRLGLRPLLVRPRLFGSPSLQNNTQCGVTLFGHEGGISASALLQLLHKRVGRRGRVGDDLLTR